MRYARKAILLAVLAGLWAPALVAGISWKY